MSRLLLLALLALVGCNTSTQKPLEPNLMGLLKVTVTGIGEGATPNAAAEWVKGGVGSQSAVVIPVNGTSAPGDVQISRHAVNFSDDDSTNTRYVYSTFDLTNRTSTGFNNFTLYAVNVPTNIGGTGIASMTAATGTAITSETVARGFQPTHGMHPNGTQYEISPNNANLQLLTPAEASDIKTQAVAQNILTNTATVLEYGFVAHNLSFGQGIITLAYKFPKVSPRQNNPFSFVLYFVVANETNSYVSQSLEEQTASTVAGLSNTTGFAQTRILSGSSFGLGQNNLKNLCQVKTVMPTAANPAVILMPSSLPAATSGSLDSCFGAAGKRTTAIGSSDDQANALAIQSDGKIVLAGSRDNGTDTDFALTRYNPDGSLDTAFGTGGKVITPIGSSFEEANAIAIQSDDKIVVAGYTFVGPNVVNYDFALVRYNPNGSLDTTFGTGGMVKTAIGPFGDFASTIALQSDGKIVVAGNSFSGTTEDFALARYNTNGSLDITLGVGGPGGYLITPIGPGDDFAHTLAIQSNGKIVVAGNTYNGSNDDFALVRYNADGSLDTAFDTDGKVTTAIGSSTDQAHALALQSDGKIVVAGKSNNGSNDDFALARYNPDGSLDTTFDGDGKVTSDVGLSWDSVTAIAIQSTSKIVVAGQSNNSSNYDFALARYNTNGSLDTTFDGDGKVVSPIGSGDDYANALALQGDGKMVVVGYSIVGSNYDFALARFNP